MMNPTMQFSSRQWWIFLVRGVLAILFGIFVLAIPGVALLTFIALFGAYAIIDGVAAIITSLQIRSISGWWLLLIEGILGILFGILVFALPGVTAVVLLYLVAFWAVVTGIAEIGAAFMGSRSAGERWGLGIAGFLSLIFGIILLVRPGPGLLAVLWVVGIYAIVFGIFLSIYAFQVRSRASALA